MGLIMEEPAAKVPEEMSEYSDSSEDENETTRISHAEVFKYHGCSWPEVVGLDAEEAERIIEEDKPELYVEVLSQHQLRTMCYATRRVRLIVDQRNRVVETPRVG